MPSLQRFAQLILATLLLVAIDNCGADDWPQWMGPNRDGEWRETGIIQEFPANGPTVRWRIGLGGGYSGPAVVGNRVFVTDKLLPEGTRDPENPFQRGRTSVKERVLCLNDADGSVVWKHDYDCTYTISYSAGPRTTPIIKDGRVYSLGAEGHLCCLNAENGAVIWSNEIRNEYHHAESPVWGYSANPLLDGDRLICLIGGKGTTVVAFHKDNGTELWRAIDSSGPHGPGYSSPVIIDFAGVRQLIVWHPRGVSSLSPETGRILWEQEFESSQGLSVATPRIVGDRLFISSFYNGSMMLRLNRTTPGSAVEWRRKGQNERLTDSLHSLISTPVIDGDYIYGACSYGEFRCLNANNGDRIWETFEPTSRQSARWGSAFIVKHEKRYVLFSEQGDLIFADLNPKGYTELGRAHLIDPTGPAQRRDVVWTHPAFANRNVYVRNDKEIASFSLAKP